MIGNLVGDKDGDAAHDRIMERIVFERSARKLADVEAGRQSRAPDQNEANDQCQVNKLSESQPIHRCGCCADCYAMPKEIASPIRPVRVNPEQNRPSTWPIGYKNTKKVTPFPLLRISR